MIGHLLRVSAPQLKAIVADPGLADDLVFPQDDAGYGPFSYLLPQQLRATSQALQKLDAAALWSRCDPERANAAAAAAAGDGLLLYIG